MCARVYVCVVKEEEKIVFCFCSQKHFKDLIKKISALPKKPKVVAQREIIKSGICDVIAVVEGKCRKKLHFCFKLSHKLGHSWLRVRVHDDTERPR